MDVAGPDALLERLASAEREIVFLVGAPLTAPVKGSPLGVPGVWAMVDRIKALFAARRRSLEELERKLKADPNAYQAAFRHVLDYRGPDAANAIVREAVLEARLPDARPTAKDLSDAECTKLENDLEGWHYPPAVEALGRLVARHPKRFGGTVLTTNFDPLIELSIRRAKGRAFSTILHGDQSLETSRGEGCHVVHVHGYWHGADTLHAPLQLGQERPLLRASLARLLNRRTLVVIAYGGWDDIFTRTLQEVSADLGAFPDVLWCFYERDAEKIESNNARVLEQLRPAIARHRATFYAGIDCHAFLPELVTELLAEAGAAGAGDAPGGAPLRDDAAFIGRAVHRDVLVRSMERGQPVQLLGPRRMGKSSLLRWVERTAPGLGRKTAFVNARGLAGRSPSDLVLAAGEALGKKAEVKAALFAESALPGARAAESALRILLPLCLLVDEADALAEVNHGFDKGFFDTLRAMGQDGKLSWISASDHDLFDVFQTTGLTSAFLNDARKLHVGALSREEAEAFLRDRAKGSAHVGWACELVGGVPPALGWIAERLAAGRVDLEEMEREVRKWVEPLFTLWWQQLNEDGRALLKRSVVGLPVGELGGAERRSARPLADAGFVVEEERQFRLWGRAWQDFVRDAG